MASLNQVTLAGNLVADVDLRVANKVAVTDLRLAINSRVKDSNGQWEDRADFIDVTVWGRQAELCAQYCKKGSPILVQGALRLDNWEKDGQKRSKLRVAAHSVQFLGSINREPQQEMYSTANATTNPGYEEVAF
jgi:single-strand DNA-binding protein